MPGVRKNTSGNTNPRISVTKRRRAVPVKRAGPRMARAQMEGAPAGVSQDLQQFTKFYPTPGRDGIVMHVCAAGMNVLKETTAAQGNGLQGGTGTNAMSVQLNLTDPASLSTAGTKQPNAYLSPVFDLIASAFVRYKVKKLIFHYEPQAAATDGQRLVFAYANDPLHPVLWNSSVPTQSDLLALADSVAFMPWRAWSMDVSHRLGDTEYFTFSDASTSVTEFVERFSDFGVISLLTSGVSAGSINFCGVLYMEMIVELREFCPIVTTAPSLLSHLSKKTKSQMIAKTKGSGGRGLPKPEVEEEIEDPEISKLKMKIAKKRSELLSPCTAPAA